MVHSSEAKERRHQATSAALLTARPTDYVEDSSSSEGTRMRLGDGGKRAARRTTSVNGPHRRNSPPTAGGEVHHSESLPSTGSRESSSLESEGANEEYQDRKSRMAHCSKNSTEGNESTDQNRDGHGFQHQSSSEGESTDASKSNEGDLSHLSGAAKRSARRRLVTARGPPQDGSPTTERIGGKKYHWCWGSGAHQPMWAVHKPEECNGLVARNLKHEQTRDSDNES